MMKVVLRFLLCFVSLFAMIFCACMDTDSLEADIGTWSFSGVVVDGSTEKALNGVSISYIDNDGVVQNELCDTNGKFFIDKLPYGERTFVFNYIVSKNSYTSKKVVVSSYAEASSLGGVIGAVSKIIQLYPLTGVIAGTLVYQYPNTKYQLPAALTSVRISYTDSSMQNTEPVAFTAITDSIGYFKISGLPLAPGGVISFTNYKKKEATYTLASKTLTILKGNVPQDLGRLVYTTTDTLGWAASILTSNVLSSDGYGKTGVSVNGTFWYKLPVLLQPTSVSVTVNGAGSPMISTRMGHDTLFVTPVSQLAYDTLVEVKIAGFTLDGEKFDIALNGISRFSTEKSPYPVEANFWSQPWVAKGRFSIGQTLWVRFSEKLDTSLSLYTWTTSSAASTIYGSGNVANSKFRISGDTLFVTPDQRLNFTYNSTIGFNVRVRTLTGKYITYYDFYANTIEDPLYIVWTNTKDEMGRSRVDMGLRDTIKVVSSVSGFQVIGLSGGTAGLVPPGLMLSDVKVSKDTIFCVPSLALKSDTTYSVDFDLQFKDGSIRRDILGISWSTKKKLSIIGTDTRVNGLYRPLAAIGDSFKVTFSEPIDTGSNAAVVFHANIKDVRNVTRRSVVKWDKECRTAAIFVKDTLPTADFDAPAAYTATAVETKAVESVTFDLVTKSGEQVLGCKPDGTPISLHTEKGMCIVQTNIISDLDGRTSVQKDFNPITIFPVKGAVDLQFSRCFDTSKMRMDSLILHAGLHKTGAVIVPVSVSILKDLKTLRITPVGELEAKTEYYVWVKNIPAEKIAGAAAINKHSGTFSGQSSSAYLLDRPFKTQ